MLIREWIGNSQGHAWRLNHHVAEHIAFNYHFHPEYELTLTLGAGGQRHIGHDIESITECDLALVAPNQPHSWQAPVRSDGAALELQVVLFRLDWLVALTEHGMPELRHLCQWLAQIRQGVVFSPAFSQLLAPRLARLHELTGVKRLIAVLDILSELEKDTAARFIDCEVAQLEPDRRLIKAMTHLQSHYLQSVTLGELAEVAACSVTTLKRLFLQQMKSSFSQELMRLRIAHASHLLLTTDRGIDWVANQSGYPCLSHFYQQFSVRLGLSPRAFRRQAKIRANAAGKPNVNRP
ncbi:AraC family transcriptional regulator [uncultured Deefgea sp.]|uniref:helix-turn-helix domain-containing protein n=1 Tax=uncultured Deefgea sp. TaxID=1304914 RepID=UPI002626CAB3|nr:AraC family transcriptional regulator [uncultured Deefgea sp.]